MLATKEKLNLSVAQIAEAVKHYLPSFRAERFTRAFDFANRAHEGQLRKEGSPYITHPLETVKILMNLRVDEDTLIAALLHDVPEDTVYTLKNIEEHFGERVAFLVEGVTKLSKVHFEYDMETRQIESLKKLFLLSAKDPRIVLIKLADRLHNMRTLQFIDHADKRIRISRETLEIYVPIAHLFGIQFLKNELEERCFEHLYPEAYQEVKKRMEESEQNLHHALSKTVELLSGELKKHGVKGDITERKKNLFSIFKRLQEKGKNPSDIYDAITFRIIVPTIDDCYKTLGIIHTLFKPKPGKFKDYIAVPKVNGYQSLHTTVFGINGVLTEIQIRTPRMHLEADFGITAHYFDTKHRAIQEDPRIHLIDKIVELQKEETRDSAFMEKLKSDIFEDRIFVFTPKGERIDLPKGSTPIDFAYAIHTDVGHHAVSAKANREPISLTAPLKTGDTIEIVTDSKKIGPSRQWISFVKTNLARMRIQEFFKKGARKQKIALGAELLQKEFNRAGAGHISEIGFKRLQTAVMEKLGQKFSTREDLLAGIGEGTLNPVTVVKSLYGEEIISEDATSKLNRFWKRLFEKIFPPQGKKVTIKIMVPTDRVGLFRDVLDIIAKFGITVTQTHSRFTWFSNHQLVFITFRVKDFETFSKLCEHIEQVEGVTRVIRLSRQRFFLFYLGSLLTIGIWLAHPLLIKSIITDAISVHAPQQLTALVLHGGLALLFIMVLMLKWITNYGFPEFRASMRMWGVMMFINTLAFFTILGEAYFFQIELQWLLIVPVIFFMYGYLLFEYFAIRKKRY